MGILPKKELSNAALCVFHISLLKVALSKVLDSDIEMKRKSGAILYPVNSMVMFLTCLT